MEVLYLKQVGSGKLLRPNCDIAVPLQESDEFVCTSNTPVVHQPHICGSMRDGSRTIEQIEPLDVMLIGTFRPIANDLMRSPKIVINSGSERVVGKRKLTTSSSL